MSKPSPSGARQHATNPPGPIGGRNRLPGALFSDIGCKRRRVYSLLDRVKLNSGSVDEKNAMNNGNDTSPNQPSTAAVGSLIVVRSAASM